MSGGFESLGLCPELVRAVEVDLGWLLPTDVQDEAIPLILGGGDVMAAAETGSGKTAAFALPVLQLVQETHRKEEEAKACGGSAPKIDWRMNDQDKDPVMGIAGDGLTCQVGAPRWAGARATIGITGGKVYYEVSILDKGIGRFGWSTVAANLNLGTDAYGMGFGGTGMKSHAGSFEKYGEAFTEGDVIGCLLDLDNGVVGFSKNGAYLGEALRFDVGGAGRQKQAYFPAIALKQATVRLNFKGPFKHPPDGPHIGVSQAPAGDTHVTSFGVRRKASDGKENKSPMAIILEPARDLAEQVYKCIVDYKRYLPDVGAALVVGGVDHNEVLASIRSGCDVIVATPGKITDLMKRKFITVDRVRFFILDEADRFCEKDAMEEIMSIFHQLPKGGSGTERLQVCFFSATLHTPEITALADRICDHPTWVDLKGRDSVPETVHHVVVELDPSLYQSRLSGEHAALVTSDDVHPGKPKDPAEQQSDFIKRLKPLVLVELIDKFQMAQCLIFCRTNLDCDLLEQFLIKLGGGRRFSGKVEKGVENPYSCCVLAGMRSQAERRANLQAFRDGDVRFLICTDVAARGIDIAGLPYVINMTLPDPVENYVHRVGRVGRADCIGLAISIVAAADIKEKVWYHTCKDRGRGCTNRALKEHGGCTIWYDEPDLLKKTEERLHMEHIPRLEPPGYELPDKIKAALGDAKYGQSVSGGPVDEAVAKHIELLQPAVADLAELEFRAQSTWLTLKQKYSAR